TVSFIFPMCIGRHFARSTFYGRFDPFNSAQDGSASKQVRGVVRAIVFDIGNVLLRWDPRNLYRKIFRQESEMEWFLAHICDGPWNEEQDRGRTWTEAIAERVARFPDWQDHIRAYDERWLEMLAGEISENVRVLSSLKEAGERTYAITN